MQRCGRYEYRPVLGCSTDPDHLIPSTQPSGAPLRIAARYADGNQGSAARLTLPRPRSLCGGGHVGLSRHCADQWAAGAGPTGSGHRVHWIQGLRSAGTTVVIRVSVVVHPIGLVQLRGDGPSLECWNHTPGLFGRRCPVIRTTQLCVGCPNGTCWPCRRARCRVSLAIRDGTRMAHGIPV